jgi:hypothetical protein
MKATTRSRTSMAMRALHFCQVQTSDDTGFTALVAQLKGEVDSIGGLVAQQQQGIAAEHNFRLQREGLRLGISQQLRHLARVGALSARNSADLGGQFRAVSSRTPAREFVPLARSMLDLATSNKDALLPVGLGATFIDDLNAALAAFEAATEAGNKARALHVGASAELDAAADRAVELVRVIDGFNRERFKGDAEQLAAWVSASNIGGYVHRHRGPRPPSPVPTPESAPTPEPTPGPAPAPALKPVPEPITANAPAVDLAPEGESVSNAESGAVQAEGTKGEQQDQAA